MGNIELEGITPVKKESFDFFTGHVQGITVNGDSFFLSSVDTHNSKGMLFKLDFNDLRLIKKISLCNTPAQYHVGGICVSGTHLIAPLAEYGKGGQSVILLMCAETLEERSRFYVEDHVGAVATDGETCIVCANWDAAEFIILDMNGQLICRIENPTDVAYQDMEWKDGVLYCSGIRRTDRSMGRVDAYKLKSDEEESFSLTLLYSLNAPQLESSISLSHEGMTICGESMFFLPEDYPDTRIYVVTSPSLIGRTF